MKLGRTVHCPERPAAWMRKFAFGSKNSAPGGARRGHGTYQTMMSRKTAKQGAIRIDGAGRPPEEWQRYDRSPVCLRLSAPGRLSPGLNACATSGSNENSFAESAAATSRSTQ